jgi:hypothetical protein
VKITPAANASSVSGRTLRTTDALAHLYGLSTTIGSHFADKETEVKKKGEMTCPRLYSF